MKRLLLLILLVTGLASMHAGSPYEGSEPLKGNTYYLWNVGRQAFLCVAGSSLAFTGRPLAFTLDGNGTTLTLSTHEGQLGSSLYGLPSANGSSGRSEWTAVRRLDNYVLSVRLPESADCHPLYFSEAFGDVRTMMQQPDDEFTDALWRFVTPEEAAVAEVTLDETDTTYTVPVIQGSATINLKRTFTLGVWNTLCVPFDIPSDRLKEQFGSDVQLASLCGTRGDELIFVLADAVEQGRPYLVKPTKAPDIDHYVFAGVCTFAEAPVEVVSGNARFRGSFCMTQMPASSYVIRGNGVSRLPEPMTDKGFSCWIEEVAASAPFITWQLQGSTGITTVGMGRTDEVSDLSGRRLKLDGLNAGRLPHGVYILNGKKIIK